MSDFNTVVKDWFKEKFPHIRQLYQALYIFDENLDTLDPIHWMIVDVLSPDEIKYRADLDLTCKSPYENSPPGMWVHEKLTIADPDYFTKLEEIIKKSTLLTEQQIACYRDNGRQDAT
jgi:hypothetical protein